MTKLVPLETAVELYGLLGSAEKDLKVMSGAGHNDIFWTDSDAYLQALADFAGGLAPAGN